MSFAFDDLINPSRINVKKSGNPVLKISRPKHLPDFYCIIESEPAARLSYAIHVIFLSENAALGVDFITEYGQTSLRDHKDQPPLRLGYKSSRSHVSSMGRFRFWVRITRLEQYRNFPESRVR